jgi:hypothetical protein
LTRCRNIPNRCEGRPVPAAPLKQCCIDRIATHHFRKVQPNIKAFRNVTVPDIKTGLGCFFRPVKMTALGSSGTDYSETVMRHVFLALTTLIMASGGNTAFAQYDCPGGQRPVPPAVAERMALPLCGFDATKRWAGNMCQLCDSRNMYPNPFVPYPVPRSRYYGLR